MKKILYLILNLIFASLAVGQQIAVTITDEVGEAVEGAEVIVTFVAYNIESDLQVVGLSNEEGQFLASGTAPLRVQVEVRNKGFYTSHSGKLSRAKDHSLKMILRKKEKPVSMYAKKASLQLPGLDQYYGFDFEIGGWVQPYGNGVESDVFFKATKSVREERDYESALFIKFEDPDEGLAEDSNWIKNSQFPSSRIAPQSSYLNSETIQRNQHPERGYGDFYRKNYIFKTRIERDEKGKIISARYGKIYNGIDLMVGILNPEKFGITFTYYFNPNANDRNLEFDPESNLFKNLEPIEQVFQP